MKKFIKKNKNTLILTSLVILLPVVFGVALWNKLPNTMPTHWGVGNKPNGYSSKAFTVFGIPAIMLLLQFFSVWATSKDPKSDNINNKMLAFVFWIIPICTVLVCSISYAYSIGVNVNVGMFVMLFLSILFIIIGNYLPKCKQTYTVGIRVPWTLSDIEIWNKTHRFAGIIWVIGGISMLIMSFDIKRTYWMIFIMLSFICFVPILYSYIIYQKKMKNSK